jgi:hypothetical protein
MTTDLSKFRALAESEGDGFRSGPSDAVHLARTVIDKYGADADKPSVHLAKALIDGAHERDELRARVAELEQRRPPLHSLCVECGPNVRVDEDGCCASCGNGAMGTWLDASQGRETPAVSSALSSAAEYMRQLEEVRAENERLRHGNTIEGDFVCPNELALTNARAEAERWRINTGLLANETHCPNEGESVVECTLRTIATLRQLNVERAQEIRRWQPVIEAAIDCHKREVRLNDAALHDAIWNALKEKP